VWVVVHPFVVLWEGLRTLADATFVTWDSL
jgi:hypothetical protein